MSKKHVFVRPARPEESQQFLDWSRATQGNLFDPEVARYPTTFTLCAFDKAGPIVYLPVQSPFMLESLAVRPDATDLDVAVAMKELTQAVVTQASLKGVGEIYFLSSVDVTDALAEKHLFEKLPYTVFRIKLKDLEAKEG